MKKRILSLLLAFLMLFSLFPSYSTYAIETKKEVTVWYFNSVLETMEEADTVELYRGGELYLSAILREDISGDVQWQIEAEQDLWVDIQGGTAEDLRVSYGMVQSLLRNNTVHMRCAISGNKEYYSDPFTIAVTDVDNRLVADTYNIERTPIAPDPLPAPIGVPNESEPMVTEETEPAATEETEPAAAEETEPVATEETEPAATERTEPAATEQTEPVTTEETEPAATEQTEPVTTEETEPASTEDSVTIVDNVIPLASPSTASIMLLSAVNSTSTGTQNEDIIHYTVTIEYVYGVGSKFAGQRVALPYIAEVAAGDTLAETVASPSCVGYTPNITSINLADLGEITGNVTRTVEYSPAEVSYTVRHYLQNVDNDEYSWVDTTMTTGYAEALTSDNAAKTYTGFTALSHYHEEIAADSSTMIDIYYDRNYYLMSFDLGGGYGVNPIYARYGADISVGTPYKAGYTFAGWVDENGTSVAIPKKMPEENRTYTALWDAQKGIGYRVTYWIVNENNSKTLIGSHIEYGASGEEVDGTGNLDTDYGTICGEELSHIHAAECYSCNMVAHSHTNSCFESFNLSENAPGDNGVAAIAAVGAEAGYIYVIYNPVSGQYWPKLYMNGTYYVVNDTQGGTTESSFSSIVNGGAIASTTGNFGGETLTVTKYQAKTDCGNLQHTHDSTCNQICTEHTHTDVCYQDTRHLEFIEADQDVVINGDGTSVVNVYYRYKEYTLKFYYAASTGTGENTVYKIVGGTTYYFGKLGPDTSDDETLLENEYWTYSGQWGTVDELPSLNDRGIGKNYISGSETYTYNGTAVTYYYISFAARFGDNISEKWPCGVFNSVTRTDKNNANGWSGTEAFVSAWNGEHHVKYSQENENQTIKGVYEKLDENLLFASDYSDEQTVSYLCFWENGANIGWSKPELYRYNIYLSAYSGQTFDADTPTIERNGVTYYLADSYDTCDDSTVDGQTQVSLVGYEPVTFYTPRNGYIISSTKKFEYRTLTGTADATQLQQDGYFDSSMYSEGYEINFYYNAKTYKLSFWNYDSYLTDGTGSMVAYNEPLEKYFEGIGTYEGANDLVQKPEKYPASLEPGVFEFEGWYTSAGLESETKVDPAKAIMPDEDLTVHARWVPITHEIKIYLTEDGMNAGNHQIGETIVVSHDTVVPVDMCPDETTLVHPSDGEATFIGWFYKDENGEEQAFDFANMTTTQDMTIYAKWRSNVMKQVAVYYVVKDENGNQTQIADTETLMLRLGQTRTFEAKTGNSLYVDYRTGCFPTTASHSITPTDADLDSEDPITYTFVYKQYGAVPYQVEFYVEKDGVRWPAFRQVIQDGEKKAEFVEAGQWSDSNTEYVEQHWNNDKAVVTELYIPDSLAVSTWALPDAYLPSALKIQKIIIPSNKDGVDPEKDIEANTIVFIYTYTEPVVDPGVDPDDPDTPVVYESRYLAQHFTQNVSDTTKYDLYSYSDETGLSGETAVASPISIPGYTYSYDVTNTNKQNGTTLTRGADGAADAMSGPITADDKLELNFYYTVNSYPYQVMYLEEGTNRVLATAKTTDSSGNQLTGLYGSTVTETAITIEGYDVVGTSSKTLYIQMEASDTASVNTIVFYYKLKSAELVISKSVELDATQAAQEGISEIPSWVYDQDFVFTIYRPEGFPKSVYHYTFTDADNQPEERTVNAGVQTIEVSLKHGESIQFHDFPMGTYTVTETYVPGFKATVNSYIAQTHTVTLDTDGEIGTLNFCNIFPFYTGDLVIKKNVNKLDKRDPTATEPYKVTVVLNPDDSTREVDRVITFVSQDGNALTDANGNSSFTIPKLTGTGDQTQFTIELLVPVGGEVKMEGVPVGSFTATEEVKGTVGYIYDFYTVKYNKAVHENDEVTGTNHVVSGSIHGGHPTAVTFNNTYKKGSLTINKTVTQEYENDNWTNDTFAFTIAGTTELPDGSYVVNGATVTVSNGVVTVKDANGDDPTISITKTDGATSWSGSLSFENLPAGYYTVTETAGLGNDKYSASVVCEPDTGLVNDTTVPAVFSFNNIYKRTTGNLQVGKQIVIVTAGSTIDATQDFTFIVEPKDSVLTESYDCTVKNTVNDTIVEGSDTLLTVSDGKLTFTLKHNQYILIEGLPVGNYLVKEEAVEGYDSSFGDVITNAGNYSVDPATITTDSTTILNCQNAYPVYYSNLIVKKTVVTPADHSAVDQAPADDEFSFAINISNYSDKISLIGGISAKFYDSAADTTPEERALSVTNNTVTFVLKDGEWVDLNLPACTYTITETGLSSTVNSDVLAAHYTTSYTVGDENGVVGSSYTLVSGERENVVFTNTYKRHYLDLTITTTCADSNQSFIFDVSATETALGDIHLTVVLVGNDSQTIKDLPVGDYTVTEQNEWSWRENAVDYETVELRTESVTVPFDFGTIDRIYWLNGYSYNIRKKGGG